MARYRIRTKFWNFGAGQAQSGQKHATSDRTKGAFLESGITYHCPGSCPTLRFRCLPHQIGRLVTRCSLFHSRDCGGSDSPLCCLPSTSRSPPLFAPTVSHFQPVPSRQKTSRTISLMSVSSFQFWCSMQMRLCPNHDICPRLDVNGHAPFGMSVFPESYVFRKIA